MPTTFTRDPDEKAIFVVHSGVMDDVDALETGRVFLDTPVEPGTVLVIDMRPITEFRVTTECLHGLIEAFRGNPRFSRCAVIATSDITFGVSRMYQMLRSDSDSDAGTGVEMRVFRESRPAFEWLGLTVREG